MSILNFGSCCIDNVYTVSHFAAPGETLLCSDYSVHPGGKGLNQSIALAKGGADVFHAGRVGSDGHWLLDLMKENGIDVSQTAIDEGPSGHANIQVTEAGENSIVLFGGANRQITIADIDSVLDAGQHEFLLIQNEISNLDYLVKEAANRSMRIILNAAPMTDSIAALPLKLIELLIINEVEGGMLTGESKPDAMITALRAEYPGMQVLLTLGEAGSMFAGSDEIVRQAAESVDALDTTGAGDTFTGFFVASYMRGQPIDRCLAVATKAAAVCVTRMGAASSIPELAELSE